MQTTLAPQAPKPPEVQRLAIYTLVSARKRWGRLTALSDDEFVSVLKSILREAPNTSSRIHAANGLLALQEIAPNPRLQSEIAQALQAVQAEAWYQAAKRLQDTALE